MKLIDFSNAAYIEEEIVNLIKSGESEYLDFKMKFHDCKAELIHDILCLANARSDSDRYIIFGIEDHFSVRGKEWQDIYEHIVGVTEEDYSKHNTQEIVNLLDNAHINKPLSNYIELHHVELGNGKRLLILHIENIPLKPFFLTKDYKDKKNGKSKIVRCGHIYSRHKDGNIPIDSTADDSEPELMYRERFGIDKTPYEKAFMYLKNYEIWQTDPSSFDIYCSQSPEYKIKQKEGESGNDNKTIMEDFGKYLGKYSNIVPQNIHGEDYYVEYNGTNLGINCKALVIDNNKRIIPYPRLQQDEIPYVILNHEFDICQILQRSIIGKTCDLNVIGNYDVSVTLEKTGFAIKKG